MRAGPIADPGSTPEEDAMRRSEHRGAWAGRLAWAVVLAMGAGVAEAQVEATVEQFKSGQAAITVECFAPAGAEPRSRPAVLLLHGAGGLDDVQAPVFRELATELAARGCVALIVHYHGNRTRRFDAWLEAVKGAVEFAAARPDVDPDRLGLFGMSAGATLAFQIAPRDPRIKAIVSLSGPAVPGMSSKLPPLLILHGAADRSTTASQIRKFEKVLKESRATYAIHIYPNAGHVLDPAQFDDAGRRTLTFLAKHLNKKKPEAEKKQTGSTKSADDPGKPADSDATSAMPKRDEEPAMPERAEGADTKPQAGASDQGGSGQTGRTRSRERKKPRNEKGGRPEQGPLGPDSDRPR
jgi:dienelactone hydrolase